MSTSVACAGRLRYRGRHSIGGRHWTLIAPDGERVSLCSVECLLEVICEPGDQFADDGPDVRPTRRRGLLELVR